MRANRTIMGMPIIVEVVGSDPENEALIEQVFSYLTEVDVKYSTYKDSSLISRYNRGEIAPAELDQETKDILAACEHWRVQTDGYFDIHHNGLVDPSGYIKGYAIEQAAKILRKEGIANFYISAGGDVVATGQNNELKPWRVGIRHPKEPAKFAKFLELSNLAIATSGNYERGAHMYNPHTGRFAHSLLSVSVIGDSIITADVLATSVFVMGETSGAKLVEQFGYGLVLITPDERLHANEYASKLFV